MPELHPRQEVPQGPVPSQDWESYWKTRGQPWRRESEIDQERQQFLLHQVETHYNDDHTKLSFDGIMLSRADIEWLIYQQTFDVSEKDEQGQRHWLNMRGAIINAVDLNGLPLERADFRYARLEGAFFIGARLEGAHFGRARLEGVEFMGAYLERADFWEAKLKGASFLRAYMERTRFDAAKMKKANFVHARLGGANFEGANLKGAIFGAAQLQKVSFRKAHLEGADFSNAQLEGANFQEARLEGASFRDAHLVDSQGVGPLFADAQGWDVVFLAQIDWSLLKMFGDELEAEKKTKMDAFSGDKQRVNKRERWNKYRAAARTYRQVATALEAQGLKEEAEHIAYRAQVMQRQVLWWAIRQDKQSFWQQINKARLYLFSLMLELLTGYGYRFERSLLWYGCVLMAFAFLYWHISKLTAYPLTWPDASILSISDMVGRGFFRQDVSLSDPYAGWSVLEGVIGVFMDLLLISTLTQLLFKK